MRSTLVCLILLGYTLTGWAEPAIERVKITDNDLSCRQIHDELGEMDKTIAAAKEAQASGENTTTAGQAGGVAADVASRTGLFGQIGGLFGHIAGTVASKVAAESTAQSGQKTVQESAEREKQALARKEQLTSLFLARGCKSSDPDAPAANPNATVALPVQTVAQSLPLDEVVRRATENLSPLSTELDLDARKVGVAAPQRVFVPGFRVAFVVKTVAKAYSGGALGNVGNQSSGFGSKTITQSQNKRVEMAMVGADRALLQALTDNLYADFVARLRASGREVIGADRVAKTPGYEKLNAVTELPYTASPWSQGDPRGYVVLTPTGLPLFFMHIDSYLGNAGPFEQQSTKAIHELAANLDAVALIPTLQIDIAEVESSGRSMFRSGADADLHPKLGVGARSELRYLNGKDAKIFYTGDSGQVTVKKPFYMEGEFGTMKTVEAFDTASIANAVTMATGLQGAQHFVEKRELRVDPLKFASGTMKVGATFNQAVVAATKP